jgi:DNA-binding protein H-NS
MYGDDKGNTWSGRGKRPNWLRNALIVGEALEQFRL